TAVRSVVNQPRLEREAFVATPVEEVQSELLRDRPLISTASALGATPPLAFEVAAALLLPPSQVTRVDDLRERQELPCVVDGYDISTSALFCDLGSKGPACSGDDAL